MVDFGSSFENCRSFLVFGMSWGLKEGGKRLPNPMVTERVSSRCWLILDL